MPSAISVSATFDSGNISVVDCSDPQNIQLEIKAEPFTPVDDIAHRQWFHFRVAGVRSTPLTIHIVNAGLCSYPEAWPGYRACASYDCSEWFRVETSYIQEEGVLTFKHACERDSIYFAYFAPYTWTRHQEVVARLQNEHPGVLHLHVMGHTLDGRDMDLLQIGDGSKDKRAVWVIARQHPGESMAEWFAEGLVNRLVDKTDSLAQHALKAATFYVVPNMNPDGSVRGHLRTNAAGANLNREWQDPQPDYAPEVLCTLRKMEETGCDAFFDVHGDEEVTYNFLAGQEGIKSFTLAQARLQDTFTEALMIVSPDYNPKNFYGEDKPGEADLKIANNAVGERFGCLSVVLEQPFKDVELDPDDVHGWSPERSMKFGGACLHAIYRVLASMGSPSGSKAFRRLESVLAESDRPGMSAAARLGSIRRHM